MPELYFGTTLRSPPALPGGGITGIVLDVGGRRTGVVPAVDGGAITPVSGIGVVSVRSLPLGGTVGASLRGRTTSGTGPGTGAWPRANVTPNTVTPTKVTIASIQGTSER